MKRKVRAVLTIGVFDGVHLGHQALLRRAVRLAARLGARPEALTFPDHPLHVLKGSPRVPCLLTREETFEWLKRKGARKVRVLPFTRAFSRKSPEQFVRWLLGLADVRGIVVGENFRFGRGAAGDVGLLKRLGGKYGFEVAAVKAVKVGGRVVSSSRIRRLLAEGKTGLANRMLGRPYAIGGEVVHGRHVGHKIGFPTANLRGVRQFLPRDGVYACAVRLGAKFYRAGMNLGQRPTFRDDNHQRQAEVHLLRYYGRLYGKSMRVHLLGYLRPERKFPTPGALVRQIQKDLARVRRVSLASIREKPSLNHRGLRVHGGRLWNRI